MKNEFIIQDNGEIDVQLSPIGSFNGSNAKGEAVPENITPESLNQLADKLNASGKEVLVDVDHASVRAGLDRDTKAMGWLSKFYTTVKGLFAKMKLTSKGKELVEGREYRFLSPVFSLNQKGEPENLHSAAFTNTPAFEGSIDPIVNHASVEQKTREDKEILKMEMTKDELVSLIKETVVALNAAPVEVKEEEKKEACNAEETKAEEVKTEEVKTEEAVVENACTEETKNETPVEETKVEETKEETTEVKDEEKKEEAPKKEEVIKIEALNSAPVIGTDISGKSAWQNLHGEEFWKYLREHPEVK